MRSVGGKITVFFSEANCLVLNRIIFIFTILQLISCASNVESNPLKSDDLVLLKKTIKKNTSPLRYRSYFEFERLPVENFTTIKQAKIDTIFSAKFSMSELNPAQEAIIETPSIEIQQNQNSSLSAKTNPLNYLLQLFPGNAYKLYTSDEKNATIFDVIAWKCPTCESQEIQYFNDSIWGNPIFPDPEINVSIPVSMFNFKLENQTYRLFNFATYPSTEYIFFSGRYSAPVMGASLYLKVGENYRLIAFEPFVNEFGTFNTPNSPQIYVADGQLVLHYCTNNGGPGEAYTTASEFIVWDKTGFRSAGQSSFSSLGNTNFGQWGSELEFTMDNNILKLTKYTSGEIFGCSKLSYHNFDWILKDAPICFKTEVDKVIQTNQPIHFELVTTYTEISGVLQETDCAIQTNQLKGKWIYKQRKNNAR